VWKNFVVAGTGDALAAVAPVSAVVAV